MTTEEIKIEWQVSKETRLGILCGRNDPTLDQIDIAEKEADAHIESLGLDYESHTL